ncbi:MAG: B12-binding domain-containing radical SAM protein [Candidatus Aminicenantes bacterium]|nr:B12-binding domain-containing radical SAM protein [Candidatus Aminicenantes bacterium]
MNILLMAMPDIIFGYPDKLVTPPNLALSSLAGNLDKEHTVRTADLVLKRKDVKGAVVEALTKTNPDIVGLSAMAFQYHSAARIAEFIKKRRPHIKIALGGYHATLMYKEIAAGKNAAFFDFIFRGESELSFNETVNRLEAGGDLKAVDGLSFKKNGRFIHNKKRELEDLRKIKLPDRSVRLWNNLNVLTAPIATIESSRGCLMSCNFCNIRMMYGESFRTYETERVMRDLDNAKKSGARLIFFADDNITLDVRKFEHLCDEIIKNGHDDLFYCVQASSAGTASSERLVEKMARAGFIYVFLGIENALKKNLKALHKGDIVNKSVQAVHYLQKYGILVAGGLIIGNPGDDAESIKESYKFISGLKVDFADIQILVPYPKTPIREELLKKGYVINKDDYRHYNGCFANVRTKYLSDDKLDFLKFSFRKKYLKSRSINALKAFMKKKKQFLRLFKGGITVMPTLLKLILAENISTLFLTEKQTFRKYLQIKTELNRFNI